MTDVTSFLFLFLCFFFFVFFTLRESAIYFQIRRWQGLRLCTALIDSRLRDQFTTQDTNEIAVGKIKLRGIFREKLSLGLFYLILFLFISFNMTITVWKAGRTNKKRIFLNPEKLKIINKEKKKRKNKRKQKASKLFFEKCLHCMEAGSWYKL